MHELIAAGVNADGKREIPGLDVATAEDGAGWLTFLRGLSARGLSGVQLVTSDCHHGLRSPPSCPASWQRCRARYARNLATKVPKTAQPWVATLVHTISGQPDAASVRARHAQVVTALEAKFPAAAAHLDEAREDILAFTAFPREIWRQRGPPEPRHPRRLGNAGHGRSHQCAGHDRGGREQALPGMARGQDSSVATPRRARVRRQPPWARPRSSRPRPALPGWSSRLGARCASPR